MLKSLRLVGASMLALGLAAPAPAIQAPQEASAPAFDFETGMQSYFQHLAAKRFREARAVTATLARTAPNQAVGKGLAAMLDAAIVAAGKKDDEARRLFAAGEAATPNTPELLGVVIPAFLIAERPDFAAMTLDRMIARAPDAVRTVDPRLVYATLRDTGEPKARVDDRRIALAELGFGGASGDYMVSAAIRVLLERGRVDQARALLADIDAPREVENLLIQRRYAVLWPALAAQAGPGLEKSRQSSVRLALQEYEESDNDPEKLAGLINAYRYAGQTDEAMALRSKLPATPAAMADAGEQTAWALNNLALALHSAGRSAEADRLFATLNGALPVNDWRVSMFINRAELPVSDGRYAEALPLIAAAEKERKSPYAEQLLRRLRYCSLAQLGRTAEAAALKPEVMAHAADAKAPTIDGLLCAGDLADAEALALRFLSEPDFEEDFVRGLQPVALTADDPSQWGDWSKLRARPAIAAAYAKLGRDLPAELIAPRPAAARPAN